MDGTVEYRALREPPDVGKLPRARPYEKLSMGYDLRTLRRQVGALEVELARRYEESVLVSRMADKLHDWVGGAVQVHNDNAAIASRHLGQLSRDAAGVKRELVSAVRRLELQEKARVEMPKADARLARARAELKAAAGLRERLAEGAVRARQDERELGEQLSAARAEAAFFHRQLKHLLLLRDEDTIEATVARRSRASRLRGLRHAFSLLRRAAERSRCLAGLASRMAALDSRRLKVLAFKSFERASLERTLVRRVGGALLARRAIRILGAWHRSASGRSIVSYMAARRARRVGAQVLAAWKALADEAAYRRSASRAIRERRVLRRCLRSWRSYKDRMRMTPSEERTKTASARACYRRALLRRWSANARYARRIREDALLPCARRRRRTLLRSALKEWRTAAEARRIRRWAARRRGLSALLRHCRRREAARSRNARAAALCALGRKRRAVRGLRAAALCLRVPAPRRRAASPLAAPAGAALLWLKCWRVWARRRRERQQGLAIAKGFFVRRARATHFRALRGAAALSRRRRERAARRALASVLRRWAAFVAERRRVGVHVAVLNLHARRRRAAALLAAWQRWRAPDRGASRVRRLEASVKVCARQRRLRRFLRMWVGAFRCRVLGRVAGDSARRQRLQMENTRLEERSATAAGRRDTLASYRAELAGELERLGSLAAQQAEEAEARRGALRDLEEKRKGLEQQSQALSARYTAKAQEAARLEQAAQAASDELRAASEEAGARRSADDAAMEGFVADLRDLRDRHESLRADTQRLADRARQTKESYEARIRSAKNVSAGIRNVVAAAKARREEQEAARDELRQRVLQLRLEAEASTEEVDADVAGDGASAAAEDDAEHRRLLAKRNALERRLSEISSRSREAVQLRAEKEQKVLEMRELLDLLATEKEEEEVTAHLIALRALS